MSDLLITTEKLTKKYSSKYAVDSVDLHIPRGSIYGLIGMNGAGKTTIMKMICGLVSPTSGSYSFPGINSSKAEAYSRIGALIEAPAIIPSLTAFDNMRIKCLAYGISDKEYIRNKLEFVGLGDVGKKKAGKFSLGMKQRLGIALALIGDPDILVLDEPINGLDPQGIVEVRELLKKLNEENSVTIVISSHILEELSKVATHYAIIVKGKLVEELTTEELINKRRGRIVIETNDSAKAVTVIDALGCKDYSVVSAGSIEVYDESVSISDLNVALIKGDCVVNSISSQSADLEEYFLSVTADNNSSRDKAMTKDGGKA